jgi:hypothetical protein
MAAFVQIELDGRFRSGKRCVTEHGEELEFDGGASTWCSFVLLS